jgi:signal transduction histidine kinase
MISDVRHLGVRSQESGPNTAALEQKVKSLEKSLADAQSNEGRMRELLKTAEAASAQAEALRREEAEMKQTYEQLKDDSARLRRSAQQLLEINRLKSEFIVNSGHELESSLQSILGLAELIEKGTYGPLTDEQGKAIRSLQTWTRRMRNEVTGLIDYGTARAKRSELE